MKKFLGIAFIFLIFLGFSSSANASFNPNPTFIYSPDGTDTKLYANENTFNEYGVTVYGDPFGDQKYSSETGKNEYRYLGYTAWQTKHTNPKFPEEISGGDTVIWNRSWVEGWWNKNDYKGNATYPKPSVPNLSSNVPANYSHEVQQEWFKEAIAIEADKHGWDLSSAPSDWQDGSAGFKYFVISNVPGNGNSFTMVGWNMALYSPMNPSGIYDGIPRAYDTFEYPTIPPPANDGNDIEVVSIDPGCGSTAPEAGKTYTAKVTIKINSSSDWPAVHNPILVNYGYYIDANNKSTLNKELTINSAGETQEISFDWKGNNNGDSVGLFAEVNPEDGTGKRAIEETTYDNNEKEREVVIGEIPPVFPPSTNYNIKLPASEYIKEKISANWRYLPTTDGGCGNAGYAINTTPTFKFPWLTGNLNVTSKSTHTRTKYVDTHYYGPYCTGHPHYVNTYTQYLTNIPTKSNGSDSYKIPVSTLDGNYKIEFDPGANTLNGEARKQYVDFTVYTPIWKEYKNYYDYDSISNPISINPNSSAFKNMLVTYSDEKNELVFITSKYTTKLDVIFNPYGTNMLVSLKKDFNSASPASVILSQKVIDTEAVYDTELNVSSPDSYTRKWSFKFRLKNYEAYAEPNPNDVQTGKIKIVGYDMNGQYDKSAYGEGSPAIFKSFVIKQTRLHDLKITDVKDIYWKTVFRKPDGALKSPPVETVASEMPLASNPQNNRLISKGYALRFEVQSEGLNNYRNNSNFNDDDQLLVRPSFWWYDPASSTYKEAVLYYDIPNQNIFNVKVDDANDAKYKTSYAKLIVNRPLYYYGVAQPKLTADSTLEDKLLSGRKGSDSSYNHTWVFNYSLHPKLKAYLRSDIDAGSKPETLKPLTGKILINFKIIARNVEFDQNGNTIETKYHYTVNEDKWGGLNQNNLKMIDAGKLSSGDTSIDNITGAGHGFTFYYNLDWSALDDYSVQQKW